MYESVENPAAFNTVGHAIKTDITSLFTSSSDATITILQKGQLSTPVKGYITNGCLLHANDIFNQHNVSNIKLTFMKNNIADSPNNLVYDYTYTDSSGEYVAFLESGEYKIRIDTPTKQFFFNQIVSAGIQEYYLYTESAAIKAKVEDTTLVYGTSKVLISGCLVDEYNTPHEGQIIISQNNQLVAFIHTLNGKYNFLLDYGIYDIRIRTANRSVVIYQQFNFQPGKGFFTELDKQYLSRNDTHIDKYLNINLPPRKYIRYTF